MVYNREVRIEIRLWRNGYPHWKLARFPEFKFWTRLFAFHITLKPLRKDINPTIVTPARGKNLGKAELFNLGMSNGQGKENSELKQVVDLDRDGLHQTIAAKEIRHGLCPTTQPGCGNSNSEGWLSAWKVETAKQVRVRGDTNHFYFELEQGMMVFFTPIID